ncbi:MAG: methylmalonyl-CoA mutase family protein [Chloroflexota bacterium]
MYRKDKLEEIASARQKWEEKNQDEFKKETKKEFKHITGIVTRRLYTPLDLEEQGFDYMKDLGFPGEYPFARGITPTMYRSGPWIMRHLAGYPTPEESNTLWRSHIAAGAKALFLHPDLPSHLGYDPDDPMAEGEVGRIGASLSSLRDWEIGLKGIDVGKIAIHMVVNATSPINLACHMGIAEQQGVDFKHLDGEIQNDILKEYMARGCYIFPPQHGLRFSLDAMEYIDRCLPKYIPTTISCYHLKEKGANLVHEAAFGIANGISYMQAAVKRGINIDTIGSRLAFHTTQDHCFFFHEIAKLRAIRRIWARVVKERFGAKNERACGVLFSSGTGGVNYTREQFLNNIARSAISDLAGALAGIQFQSLRGYDEQWGIPSPDAQITNIRIHQIVANETGVTETVDPLAGSYFVESLTSEYEERINKEIQKIDEMGGMVKCIESGYAQRQMAADAYEFQKQIEAGVLPRVGHNIYRSEGKEDRPWKVYRAKPEVEQKRINDVRELKKNRDNAKVEKALAKIGDLAKGEPSWDNNLVPPIFEAVKAYATMGEICGVLRKVWGEYHEPSVF